MTMFRALFSPDEENQYRGIQLVLIQRWISKYAKTQNKNNGNCPFSKELSQSVARCEPAQTATERGTLQPLEIGFEDSSEGSYTKDELMPLTGMKRADAMQALVNAPYEIISKRRNNRSASIQNIHREYSPRELAERAVNRANRLKRLGNKQKSGKSKKRQRLTPEREAEMIEVCKQIFEQSKEKSQNEKGRNE